MKTQFGRIVVVVIVFLLGAPSAREQDNQASKTQKFDTRIVSHAYWQEVARLGLVEVAPVVPVKRSVYTSSRIDVPGILAEDSPDVPVTNDLNTTQSENSIFVHPWDNRTVFNSNNSTGWKDTIADPIYGADFFISFDSGGTWFGSVQGVGGTNWGDPAAVIGANGWFYVGYITPDSGQAVAYSSDGGYIWTRVQVEDPPDSVFLDKNHLWTDNSPSSPHEGNLYSAWTYVDRHKNPGPDDGEIMISRSSDSGLSWSTPVEISSAVNAGSHNQGVNIQTGPSGEVYVAWSIYDYWSESGWFGSDEAAIGFTKSLDGGVTFEPATRIIENIRGIRITKTSKSMRVNSFPVMAVDISGGPNNGTIYLVWTNYGVPGINIGPDIDVYMIKSTDTGSTWSAPIRVNQDPPGLGKEHFFPWITCDPVSGALSVVFYDDRNVDSTDCEVFVACSEGAGEGWTWFDFKVSDVSFTPSPVPGLALWYFGDYLGISARGGKVYPAWTDNRDGRAMTYVSPFTYSSYPHVIAAVPAQNELNMPDSAYISVTFNVDIDEATINDSTLVVNARSTGRHEGTIIYDSPTRTATLYPYEKFGDGELVTVAVTTDIESFEGIPLGESHVWSFTVAADDGSGTFAPDSVYAVGDEPQAIFAADLDGDGDVDIITTDNGSDSVSVLLNNGDGTFANDSRYQVGNAPYKIFAADLDGDGDVDITTGNPGSSNVSVLLNMGDGTFAPHSVYPVGSAPVSVFAADLDGDGDIDITTANVYSGDISILLNYGNGTFAPHFVYAVGDDPNSVVAADLDGDGDLDLAVTDTYPLNNNVSVLLNSGDATFSLHSVYPVGYIPYSIFAADLDGDGDLDLATANSSSGDVSVLLNYGNGTFASHSVYPVGGFPEMAVAADLDGDGDLDLTTANLDSDNISVLLNYGDGTFAPYSVFPVGDMPLSVFAADLDGDGDLDLTSANNNSNNISVLLNYHAVQIVHTAPTKNELGVPVSTDILVEFDIDMEEMTINDTTFVVNARSTGRHEGAIFYDGEYKVAVFDPVEEFDEGEVVTVVLTSDIESPEGDPLGKSYAWSFTTAVENGAGTFVLDSVYRVADGPTSVFAADLDGDGDLDVTTANAADSISVLLNNGDGTFAPDSVYPAGDYPWSVFAADLDGDGDMDLTTANSSSGDVSVLLNYGNGTFAPDSVYPAGDFPWSVFAADLDGDGDMDLTTANRNSFDVSVLLNNGDGTFAPDSVYPVGDDPRSIFAADLDGDGHLDLTTANAGSDNVSVFLNNGDGTFAPDSVYLVGDFPNSIFAADLDGDGDLDLTTANSGSDNVSILLNDGDGIFAPGFVCSLSDGANPWSVFAADLDGDGDMDLTTANFDPSSVCNVSVLLNYGDATFASYSEYQLNGILTSSIFAADLDGDGDLDLTASSLGSGNIFILLNQVIPDAIPPQAVFTNSLAQNYPNPFNPTTTIKYSIKDRAHVTLKIYNVAGQLVKTLVNEEQNPRGNGFTIRWNGRSNSGIPVSSGVYFYRLVTKNFTQTKKLVVLK